MSLKILAYGVNGDQMSAGTQALVDAGHQVTAFTRSAEGAKRWQAAGVKTVVGNLADPESLRRANEGQDAVFLHVPLINGPDEDRVKLGLNAINAAKEAGVTRIVWNTGAPITDPSSETDTNAILLRALQDGGFSFLALSPVVYMENLLGPWTSAGLVEGKLSYPTPENFQMQWVAAADVGRIADKALRSELPNEAITLGGPEALDGNQLASRVGEAIGRSLNFSTIPQAEFERQLTPFTGPQLAAGVSGMYGAVQANPDQFQPGFVIDSAANESRFDLKLTSVAQWVATNELVI